MGTVVIEITIIVAAAAIVAVLFWGFGKLASAFGSWTESNVAFAKSNIIAAQSNERTHAEVQTSIKELKLAQDLIAARACYFVSPNPDQERLA